MRRALVLSLALLSGPLAASPGGSWLRYPLPGAEVKALVAEPRAPGAFYAGTAQGGLYRSTDGGRSWQETEGGPPFPGYSVTSLSVDPLSSDVVWAALTGVLRGGLLLRSDDRGRSWVVVRRWDDRAAARVVALAERGGRRILAVGGDGGIEISEDGGTRWRSSRPALDPGAGVSFLQFHPLRPGTLFCGSYRHPFRSDDLGVTWRRIAKGMVQDTDVFDIDFSPTDPDDLWAATCGWVYRSTDGGGSWTRHRDGLSDRRSHVVRRDLARQGRVLVGTTGGLFETRDAGRSFRPLLPGVVVNAVLFDPQNPAVLLVGTESDGVLRSEDGGVTLTDSSKGMAEARVSAVAETASGRVIVSRAADGTNGGLWELEPASARIVRLPGSPPSTIRALASSGERLLAGTPDGLYLATVPGGPFSRVLSRSVTGFAQPPGRIVAATDQGVWQSKDGGGRWERLGTMSSRVDAVAWSRLGSSDERALVATVAGRPLWWGGSDWAGEPRAAEAPRQLSGGFGKPRVVKWASPRPIGVAVDPARALLVFRPEDGEGDLALLLPEPGLAVAGWSGDPRRSRGLYIATIGRGLFRYIPAAATPPAAGTPAASVSAPGPPGA